MMNPLSIYQLYRDEFPGVFNPMKTTLTQLELPLIWPEDLYPETIFDQSVKIVVVEVQSPTKSLLLFLISPRISIVPCWFFTSPFRLGSGDQTVF